MLCVAKKEIDDGNTEDYIERLKLWEEQRMRQAEAGQAGDHEMEGGYRLPKALWCKLYK
jgi:predicted RecA/RadA family phage recombinase